MLHDSALQTLEAVGSGRYRDDASMRSRALDEARRLERELEGIPVRARSLAEEIGEIARACAAHGLEVEVRAGDYGEPPLRVAVALRDGCNEALTNVAKHAGVGRASVTIAATKGGVEVAVVDDGAGFEPSAGAGFGTTESIRRRLTDAGGGAEVISRPGAGTRVVLWGPA
jgi:signal transduction histidine kinase